MTDHHDEDTSSPSTSTDAQPSNDPNEPPPVEQPADSPASPAPLQPPPDPVEALKKQLAQKKVQAGDLNAEAKHLEGDIATLKAAQADRDRILDAYEKAVDGLTDQLTDHDQYHDRTHQGVVSSLPTGRMEELDKTISEINDAVTKATDAVDTATSEQTAAKSALDTATSAHDGAQSGWKGVKDYQESLEQHLKALTNLRQVIEAQDSENNLDKMYYWLTVFNGRLPAGVRKLGQLTAEASQAFGDLVAKKANLRTRTDELREADAALATATTTQAALQATREADILAAIEALPEA